MEQIFSKAVLDTMMVGKHLSVEASNTGKPCGAVFLPCSCLLSAKKKSSVRKERFEKVKEAFPSSPGC